MNRVILFVAYRFLRVLTHTDQVDTLERSDACDVFEYEMPPSSDNFKLFLPVYMREKNVDLEQKTRSGSSPQKRASTLQAPEALFDRNSKVTVWH
ncbi:uncharacterized protein LOC142767679 isoform X2 [Rhipicephalus microplus]|uniref:uncharacterized protein LOC142767679 isoform X2 n=1 Tax=Rhipicephalus microplus TaxID=6941 RepID=UPI003F6C12AF